MDKKLFGVFSIPQVIIFSFALRVYLLLFSRWLNNYPCQETKIIKFDPVAKILNSTSGLRVIELRNRENGMVLLDWVFVGRILKYSFQLPEEKLETLTTNPVVVYAEDNIGNILKHEIKIV